MAESNFVIDPPVNPYSTPEQVRAWIAELEKMPQEDQSVKLAMNHANYLLDLVTRSE